MFWRICLKIYSSAKLHVFYVTCISTKARLSDHTHIGPPVHVFRLILAKKWCNNGWAHYANIGGRTWLRLDRHWWSSNSQGRPTFKWTRLKTLKEKKKKCHVWSKKNSRYFHVWLSKPFHFSWISKPFHFFLVLGSVEEKRRRMCKKNLISWVYIN